MEAFQDDSADLEALIRDVPDFPKPGIVFKDITPVLADPTALRALIERMAAPFLDQSVEVVAGIEARGFVLATPVAAALGTGFVPLRKPGKLPYSVASEEYSLEYGTDALEVHTDAVKEGTRVLIVDDVIATGGTAGAAIRLLQGLGADVVGLSLFVELAFLGGRASFDPSIKTHSVVVYE